MMRITQARHQGSNANMFFFTVMWVMAILSGLGFWQTLPVEASEISHHPPQAVDMDDVTTFINLASSYLVRSCHDKSQDPRHTGKFTYEANLHDPLQTDFTYSQQMMRGQRDPGDSAKYNLLRHSGAIYGLALSYQREPNDDVLKAMLRSVDYLKDKAIRRVPALEHADYRSDLSKFDQYHDHLLAAWESQDIASYISKPVAKLGGAGLALVALVSLERICPGQTPMDELRQLAEWIAFMQHENGSFTSRYSPKTGGKDESWVSLYYPGEACLGLVYLASIEDDPELRAKWIRVATDALKYLYNYRKDKSLSHVEFDHWALIVTAQFLPLLEDEESEDYQQIYQHAIKVVEAMLSRYTPQQLARQNGCFNGRETCGTASSLEGLISALHYVKEEERFQGRGQLEDESLRARIEHDVTWGIHFLLKAQETSDHNNMHGGVPERWPHNEGNRGDAAVRIDYVQHSVSAMIFYENYMALPPAERKDPELVTDQTARFFKKKFAHNPICPRVPTAAGSGGSNGSTDIINPMHLLWLLAALISAFGLSVACKRRKKTRTH